MNMLQCPHCGWIYSPDEQAELLRRRRLSLDVYALVPHHAYPATPVGGRLCPGSEQHPRNPEADNRPLWKDGGVR